MKRLVVGYLTYINDANGERRLEDFKHSLKSISLLKNDKVEFVSVDNNSLNEVKRVLLENDIFSKHFHYKQNYFDVALFYTTVWYAAQISADYACFLYDDFIAYDDAFEDIIEFMDANPDVSCTRIPAYDFDNKKLFDPEFTPKSINPDSIRHKNNVTNKDLIWQGPFDVNQHRFYKNNWHYTSRPTIWKTSFLNKVLESQGQTSTVLQGFEGWAGQAFEKENLVVGILDKGMVKTTPVVNSARGLEIAPSKETTIRIDLEELRSSYNNFNK